MPIDRYECRACGQIFEVVREDADPPVQPACPACGQAEAARPLPACAMECAKGEPCGSAVPGFA